MKKLLIVTLTLFMSFSCLNSVLAEGNFIQKSIPYPEGQELWGNDYQAFTHLLMRYADDKTPIALSAYVDGYMHATIPQENADRPLEIFVSEERKFADSDSSYESSMMRKMSAQGIIQGDQNGNANPNANITRAEATAMVMRLLGISENEDIKREFTDVEKNDWYYNIVNTARIYGIVEGDSENIFNPNRLVSREEIVVMVARGLYKTGMQTEINTDVEKLSERVAYEDAEKISHWAINSYYTMDTYAVHDYVNGDDFQYIKYANPQKPATRFEVAEMMFRVFDAMQIYPYQIAIEYGFDKEMPVIDGSTSTYPFTDAVYRNLFLGGYQHPDRPDKHSKSHASYERLINGEVDMLFASVYPASDIIKLAEEKGVELELIPIAYDAMIFFTNAENPATNLTKQQITDIYVNNKYENWSQIGGSDALLYPYCRNNDSGSHAQMEKHFLKGSEINEKIRNETTSVTMSNVLTDVMGAKTESPLGYGLGYSIYYYYNNMDVFYDTSTRLKLLAIDGIFPNDETIANGTYPLSNNTYVVLRSDTPKDAPARKMAEFMLTEAGQECVKQAGYGRLK